MNTPSPDLKSLIAGRIAGMPGAVWTPADFLDLGRREAVDKALQRLVAAKKLRRVERGLYDSPKPNPLTGKPSVPDYRRIIDAVSRRDQVRMLVDGMTAANDLGLSDAVPGQIVVHADGRLRPIRIGNQKITFRPTSPSKLYWAGRPAMRVVQALHWLRETLARPEDAVRITRQLRNILGREGEGTAIAADLRAGLATLPGWMQDLVRELLESPEDHPRASKRVAAPAGGSGGDRGADDHHRHLEHDGGGPDKRAAEFPVAADDHDRPIGRSRRKAGDRRSRTMPAARGT